MKHYPQMQVVGREIMIICPHCQYTFTRKPAYLIQAGPNIGCLKCTKSMYIDPEKLGLLLKEMRASNS
jgi:hypothetical protein